MSSSMPGKLDGYARDTLRIAIEERVRNDRVHRDEAFLRAQRATKSGDLVALIAILAASADAQAAEAAEYVSSLD